MEIYLITTNILIGLFQMFKGLIILTKVDDKDYYRDNECWNLIMKHNKVSAKLLDKEILYQ